MLEIDREVDDERPAPSTEEAELARDAAQATLNELPGERAHLTAAIADAVGRGAFEEARSARDKLALAEDRAAFAEQQLRRAELALVMAAGVDAEADAREATTRLEAAFLAETQARLAHDDSVAALRGAQAHLSAAQSRVASLKQKRSSLELAVQGKGE